MLKCHTSALLKSEDRKRAHQHIFHSEFQQIFQNIFCVYNIALFIEPEFLRFSTSGI